MRDHYLRNTELKEDGSGAPHVLTARTAVRVALQAEVSYFSTRPPITRLRLGAGHFSFQRRRLDREARAFLAGVRTERRVSEGVPGTGVVLLALDDSGEPTLPLALSLDHELQMSIGAESRRRNTVLANVFETLGWRQVSLPVPEGPADPRIGAVARFTDSQPQAGPHNPTPRELLRDMESGSRTLAVVPDPVESVLQVARLLYIRGWHQWEFFTLAKREACTALETSLRSLNAEEGGPKSLTFAALLDRVGLQHQPPLLSQWERWRGHCLRRTRNELTHPSRGASIDWISWARADLEQAVLLINLMWARLRGEVPAELAWDPEPEPHLTLDPALDLCRGNPRRVSEAGGPGPAVRK